MRKTCGKNVQTTHKNLGSSCVRSSTPSWIQRHTTNTHSGYTSFLRTYIDRFHTDFSTLEIFTRYLLHRHLFALSPAPITTTTNEKKGKN